MKDPLDRLMHYKTIAIQNKEKASYFLNSHSTKEGSWAEFRLIQGKVEFIFIDAEGSILSSHVLKKEGDKITVPPSTLHKLKLLDEDFSAEISFFCQSHRYFSKKYALGNVHSDLLYAYDHYLADTMNMKVLDVGCGQGRNLLFLAKEGHHLTGIDYNEQALDKIALIAQKESLENIQLIKSDLNNPLPDELGGDYDLIISTVSLQFLDPDRIEGLLTHLRAITKVGGMHILVFPIAKSPFVFPAHFSYLAQEKELYNQYQQTGWSLLEYKEQVGRLHREDENGFPIQGIFALLVAQRHV